MIPKDAEFVAQDYRANFKQIIAKRSELAQFDAGRLIPAGAGLTYELHPGQVLGKVTASGLYKVYNNANSDGSEVAVGVLNDHVIVDEFGNGSEISIIKVAILFEDYLIGLDSAAKTDLKSSSSVEHGVNLIRINA